MDDRFSPLFISSLVLWIVASLSTIFGDRPLFAFLVSALAAAVCVLDSRFAEWARSRSRAHMDDTADYQTVVMDDDRPTLLPFPRDNPPDGA